MQAEYNVTDLSNGFTVLTESTTFPGSIHMGKSSISLLYYKMSNLVGALGMFICCLINNNKLMMAFMYYRIPNGRGYS